LIGCCLRLLRIDSLFGRTSNGNIIDNASLSGVDDRETKSRSRLSYVVEPRVMPQSHTDDPSEPKHMARTCTMCGLPMFLSLIEPSDRPGHDRRLFQCAGCEYSESVTVK